MTRACAKTWARMMERGEARILDQEVDPSVLGTQVARVARGADQVKVELTNILVGTTVDHQGKASRLHGRPGCCCHGEFDELPDQRYVLRTDGEKACDADLGDERHVVWPRRTG